MVNYCDYMSVYFFGQKVDNLPHTSTFVGIEKRQSVLRKTFAHPLGASSADELPPNR